MDSPGSFSVFPIFMKAQGYACKRSLAPIQDRTNNLLIPSEARHNPGPAGTMCGSIGSTAEQEFDPDSDIPDRLQIFSLTPIRYTVL